MENSAGDLQCSLKISLTTQDQILYIIFNILFSHSHTLKESRTIYMVESNSLFDYHENCHKWCLESLDDLRQIQTNHIYSFSTIWP